MTTRIFGSVKLYEASSFAIGEAFRRSLYHDYARYPWAHWVRLMYNDALTHQNGAGGVRASWRFRQFQRASHNKALMPIAIHLENIKTNEAAIFDKLSLSDFTVAAAYTTIQEAGGPILMHDFQYGR